MPTAAAIFATARRWASKHPDLSERLDRAVALVDNVRPTSPDVYSVEGSEGHGYVVRVRGTESTCTCQDFARRGIRCKHRLAVALMVAAKA